MVFWFRCWACRERSVQAARQPAAGQDTSGWSSCPGSRASPDLADALRLVLTEGQNPLLCQPLPVTGIIWWNNWWISRHNDARRTPHTGPASRGAAGTHRRSSNPLPRKPGPIPPRPREDCCLKPRFLSFERNCIIFAQSSLDFYTIFV